jgi:diguanylate cyclase
MFSSLESFKDFCESLAVMALLALAYGQIQRLCRTKTQADMLLGLLFGAVAVYCMLDPLEPTEGVLFDMRHVPVVVAAVYLRWPGAVLTLGITMGVRFALGGTGMPSGLFGLGLNFGIAILLGHVTARPDGRTWRELAVIAGGSTVGLVSILTLPGGIGPQILATIGVVLAPLTAVGVLVTARVLEREIAVLSREKTLLTDAQTDPLTGLLNRRGFEAAYDRRRNTAQPPLGVALMLLDLDHFKSLNDRYGHAFGDTVLRTVSDRIRAAQGPDAIIARIGGEELVVQTPRPTEASAIEAAQSLCDKIRDQPIVTADGQAVQVTVSIGVVWTPAIANRDRALRTADAALYQAKNDGRDRAVLFAA